jgi:hypothetical protein
MLTFGQSLGFLETGEDLHGVVKLQKGATYYAGVVSLSYAFHLSILEPYMCYAGFTDAMA